MRSRASLISSLAEDLQPVGRALSPMALALAWLLGSWNFVTALTVATGPMRPGFATQLAAEPRFLLESVLGLAVGVLAIRATAGLGIPSPRSALRQAAPALLLFVAWVGVYVYGLYDPALAPSMVGKREYCYLQTLIYAGPPLAAGLWLVRRAAPLARVWTGALAGAAAASLPALMMQLACMYDPAHILSHHIAPIAAAALAGGLLGPFAFRRI